MVCQQPRFTMLPRREIGRQVWTFPCLQRHHVHRCHARILAAALSRPRSRMTCSGGPARCFTCCGAARSRAAPLCRALTAARGPRTACMYRTSRPARYGRCWTVLRPPARPRAGAPPAPLLGQLSTPCRRHAVHLMRTFKKRSLQEPVKYSALLRAAQPAGALPAARSSLHPWRPGCAGRAGGARAHASGLRGRTALRAACA